MSSPHIPSPDRGIQATPILADFAQVTDGKLTIVGGGWSFTGSQPSPFAIAVLFEVPWHLTNRQHVFRLELIDLDGNPVSVETPNGAEPLLIEGQFEAGRAPGTRTGTGVNVPLALNHGPVPLPPGSHFEWRLSVNGETQDDWRLAFSTRPEAQSHAA